MAAAGGGAVSRLAPITLRAASAFVDSTHRHHRAPRGGFAAISVISEGAVRAVAIYGRPVARRLQDGWTAEVLRVASDGHKNACSMLYGACWRSWRARGGGRMVTYTLDSESGASLRGAGWSPTVGSSGGSWSRGDRPREDKHPLGAKLRWEVVASWYVAGMASPPAVAVAADQQCPLPGVML